MENHSNNILNFVNTCFEPMSVEETVLVVSSITIVVIGWVSLIWLFLFTIKEAKRQRQKIRRHSELANQEGGVAMLLAKELNDSLYMTDKMLKDHKEFKNLYEKMPKDYPDAFTLNMAKLLQEERFFEFYNENDEVEYMIRRLFKDPKQERDMTAMEEEFYYENKEIWDSQEDTQDTLKRRLNKFKKMPENKMSDFRSSSIHSGCARRIQRRDSSVFSTQLNFHRILSRSSYDSVLRPSLRKSLKHLNTKYKKNSCSSLQTISPSRYYESSHRLSLDLPGTSFMGDEDAGTIREIASNQPMSSKRKRSRRYGLSFHELNDASHQKKTHLNYSYLDENAVSTF